MIEDAKKGQFSAVLVHDLSRFGRNLKQSIDNEYKLQKAGVALLSATEDFAETPSCKLHRNIMVAFAQFYIDDLSVKVSKGMEKNAQKGLSTGGNIALGYKLEKIDPTDEKSKKTFVLDEDTVPIVKKIFEMYGSGKTVFQIIDYLNEQQIKTSTGAKFNKNSLRFLLKNKRYIGIYTYKGTEKKGGIPHIIDDKLFNKVQKMMDKNKKAPARSKEETSKIESILTTKLFCGNCKDLMTGYSGTSKTKEKIYYYYSCNNVRYKNEKGQRVCSKKNVRKEYIEDTVIMECQKQLSDSNITKIASEFVDFIENEKSGSNLKRLEKLLKNIEKEDANITKSLRQCKISSVRESIFKEIAKVQEEKKDIEKQIAIEKIKQNNNITVSDVKFFLNGLKDGDINDIKYRKTLINIFVNQIYLYDDGRLTIIFNVVNKGKPVTVDTKLLEEIECSNADYKGSCLEHVSPPTNPHPARVIGNRETL